MNFNDVVDFAYVMFLYVLPAILLLIAVMWLKDWIVRVAVRWRKSAEKKYEEFKEDRWFVILELMKILMFFAFLFPLLAVINYAINEDVEDPGHEIMNHTMPYVWIIITSWYLFAIVVYGIYAKSKQDKEREKEQEIVTGDSG